MESFKHVNGMNERIILNGYSDGLVRNGLCWTSSGGRGLLVSVALLSSDQNRLE